MVIDAPRTDDDLPAYWDALGLPGIVDVHVHLMPDRLQAKVWEYFAAGGELLGREWHVPSRRSTARDGGPGVHRAALPAQA